MALPQADFYAAPNGDDSWSGRLPAPNAAGTDGPFATLQRARDAIRQLKAADGLKAPVTVMVRGGVYFLAEPFVLGPEDSGTETCPITYVAYLGEKPVLSGGKQITGWKRGEGELWVAEVPDVKAGHWYFRQLFVNGKRRPRARIPNEGFYTPAEMPPEETWKDAQQPAAFKFNPGEIEKWTKLEDVEVVFLRVWDEARLRIAEIDLDTNTITFTSPRNQIFRYTHVLQRYYVENVFEGLDSPGEWYLDRQTGIVYYWPMPDEDMTTAEVIAPAAQQLIRVQGNADTGQLVEYVTVRGFTICHTDWELPPGGYPAYQASVQAPATVYAEGALFCSFEENEIVSIGNWGIELAGACRHNRIVGNRIHDVGAGGIRIGETVIRPTDAQQSGQNVVTDNYIYDGGRVYLCAVGVWVGQSGGNVVSHNEIHDLNYTGISVGWTWGYGPSLARENTIEHNHIYNIGRGLLSDMGGIYTLGISPGTKLRYNLIHDVESYDYGAGGLYTDEGSSNILIENNVVYNTKTGSFDQHYGRENIVRNNIFAFSRECQITRTREEEYLSFTFERNIVYFNNGQLLGGNWGNGNYRMDNNLYWDTSNPEIEFAGSSFEQWQAQRQDQNSIIADPLFVDPDNRDFTLKPESPALKLGIKPIDMSDVGPRR